MMGGGRDFPHPSRPPWGTPSFLYNRYRVYFPEGGGWVKWPRLKNEYRCTSFPPWAFKACSGVNFTYLVSYPSISLHCKRHRHTSIQFYHTVNTIRIHYKDRLDITTPVIMKIVSGVTITTRLRHVACKTIRRFLT